jgi:multidrug resistance efflux pump
MQQRKAHRGPAEIEQATGAAAVPVLVEDAAVVALRRLLHLEAEIRRCASLEALNLLLVNEVRSVTGARLAYVAEASARRVRLIGASGSGGIDRDAPSVRWLEARIAEAIDGAPAQQKAIALRIGTAATSEEGRAYPFSHLHWLPTYGAGKGRRGGMVLAGEAPLTADAITLGLRLAETAAHAARVLAHRTPRQGGPRRRLLLTAGVILLGVLTLAIPVPMSALAPMEVAPRNAFVVAAPIDGVIDEILVPPNAMAKAGEPIARYVDTATRNQLQVAERELAVAETRLRQLQQMAFVDDRAKRDLAQARSEVSLKRAERDFARDTAEKSVIRAPRDGLALYGDRKEWTGRPVSIGQRILELADPAEVELRAHLAVGDVLDLAPGARVRAFLDGDPLHPLDATLTFVSHQARPVEGVGLSYRVLARFDAGSKLPRPGARGTAQLFGGTAPLGFYLFRRPLVWARQKFGV